MGFQDEQKINSYLGLNGGDASYGQIWSDLQKRLPIARKRYENIVKRYFGVYDNGLVWHVELADHLNYDLEMGFRQLFQGRRINKEDLMNVLQLFDFAMDTIESEIDTFESIWVKGLVSSLSSFFTMFPFRELNTLYTQYLQTALSLQRQLENAKSEKLQAYVDKGIDIFGLILEIIPEIRAAKEFFKFYGDTAKSVFAGASLLADKYLGPQEPDEKKILRTTGHTVAGLEKLDQFVKFSSASKKVMKSASLINSVSDAISWDEINEAKANIEAIEKNINDLKAIYEKMKKGIWDMWAIRVEGVKRDLERAQMLIKDDEANNVTLVSELYKFRKEIRYSSPMVWRTNP
jgi:hypothetical protein